ncbi:hypothetical protein JYU34_000934 [Plutella xylostella]|uniref:Uncharacterized protein n=1 Tax=Plutella xylostella TaxID=51655 RepID=A0ABQ7R5P9_PLUXY|nr:hypothetical protein JYU34_000934 [Plutella xylostella]
MILNDNDDADINPAGLNELHCLKKYRKQDGSSEMILNDNDDADINPADLNELHCDKQPPKHKRRVNMAYLLSILTRRRRDPARALAAQQQCTMRDSCRCDDCQVSNTIRYRGVTY